MLSKICKLQKDVKICHEILKHENITCLQNHVVKYKTVHENKQD